KTIRCLYGDAVISNCFRLWTPFLVVVHTILGRYAQKTVQACIKYKLYAAQFDGAVPAQFNPGLVVVDLGTPLMCFAIIDVPVVAVDNIGCPAIPGFRGGVYGSPARKISLVGVLHSQDGLVLPEQDLLKPGHVFLV